MGWRILKKAILQWVRAEGLKSSAALAFYALLSLAPLLLIVTGVTGILLGEQTARSRLIIEVSGYIGEESARLLQEILVKSSLAKGGLGTTLIGIGMMLLGSTSIFAHLSGGLNRIWSVQSDPKRNDLLVFISERLIALLMVFAMAPVLILFWFLSALVSGFRDKLSQYLHLPELLLVYINFLASFLLIFMMVVLLYRFLPAIKVRWRDILIGAFFTSVMLSAGRALISLYISHLKLNYFFGAASSLLVLLFWIYYSSLIFYLGASLIYAYVTETHSPFRPSRGAVLYQIQILKTPVSSETS